MMGMRMAQVIHLSPDESDKVMRQQLRMAQKLGAKAYLTADSKTVLIDSYIVFFLLCFLFLEKDYIGIEIKD